MKTMLEVFYLRIIDNTVYYQRRLVNLSKRTDDPDTLIQSLIQHKSTGKAKEEFVVHSTSWRYTSPSKIVLTYIAYSDELIIKKSLMKKLSLKELRRISISTGKPRSKTGGEKQVVAHGMRHISFLIKTDYAGEFENAFSPRTRKIFKSLWGTLAGRSVF